MRINKSLSVLITTFFLSLKLVSGETAITFAGDSTEEPSGDDLTAGWQFTTLAPIRVTSLGFYDGGSDGLVNPHPVAIWDNSGKLIVKAVVPPGTGTRREGFFRYVDIPETQLNGGVTYVIGSLFYKKGADNYNGADLRASITISSAIAPASVKSRTFFLGKEIGFPPGIGGPIAYFGPNFQFQDPPDITAIGLSWKTAQSTVEFSYEILSADLSVDTQAAFYWATEPNYLGLIHPPLRSVNISRSRGKHGPVPVDLPDIGFRPPDAKYLVLVLDPVSPLTPRGLVNEIDDINNNLAEIPILTCAEVVGGAVNVFIRGAAISADFIPNHSLTLRDAAITCGFDHFNWINHVENDPYPPEGLPSSYNDPPSGGGKAFGGTADALPFYYDEWGPNDLGFGSYYDLQSHTDSFSLDFLDQPCEPKLRDTQRISFVTSLVGIKKEGGFDVLKSFEWFTDYNGSVGGIGVRRDEMLPSNGTRGGVFGVRLIDAIELSDSRREWLLSMGARNLVRLYFKQSNDTLTIFWPQSISGFTLETSGTLNSLSWETVLNVDKNSVSLNPASAHRFFRLRKLQE